MWLAKVRAPKFGVSPSKILDAAFWMLVAGVLGARIVFILQELPYYLKHLNELFSLQFEGLTSFGGLIFGFGALVIWARREKLPFGTVLDIVAPAFLVGHIFGRFGCLLNGCCYGGVCPDNFIFATHFQGLAQAHQPAQVYDALMNAIGLGAILLIEKKGLRVSQTSALVFIVYGLARFIYEFWRAGTDEQVRQGLASSTTIGTLPITQAQVMAAALVLGGVVWFVLARRNQPEFYREPYVEPSPGSEPLAA